MIEKIEAIQLAIASGLEAPDDLLVYWTGGDSWAIVGITEERFYTDCDLCLVRDGVADLVLLEVDPVSILRRLEELVKEAWG